MSKNKKQTESIMTDNYDVCYIESCNARPATMHHPLEGNGRRKVGDRYGLKVPICEEHHRWCHQDSPKHQGFAEALKIKAQLAFERVHGTRKEFKELFGRYYVNDKGL